MKMQEKHNALVEVPAHTVDEFNINWFFTKTNPNYQNYCYQKNTHASYCLLY